MLGTLLMKELRDVIGSTKFSITFGVCAVLILLSFYVGAKNYTVNQTEFESARAENLKQMEGLTDWDDIDHRIGIPPQPLKALVSGVSNDIGRSIEMESRGELQSEDSRFNEDPIFAVFRFLDLEFIFTVVLSLFAILFGYDAINGEKERGTLRLSFSNPVPRHSYILSKILGSLLALIVPLLIAILIGCIMLPLLGVPMDGATWGRLAMIIIVGLLYFSVFLTLSVAVSAMTEKSSSSFLVMLVIWIFAVLIIPRTAVLIAGRAVDVDSIDKVTYDKVVYNSQIWSEDRKEIRAFWSQNSGMERQQMMTEFRRMINTMRKENEEELAEFSGRVNETRENQENRRTKIALGFARISPASSFQLAATNLAGTSLNLKRRYRDAANDYQVIYRAFMVEKTGQEGGGWGRGRGGNDEEEEEINPYELPEFVYEEPETSELVGGAIVDMGILMFFNLIFFGMAFFAFLKYDVR